MTKTKRHRQKRSAGVEVIYFMGLLPMIIQLCGNTLTLYHEILRSGLPYSREQAISQSNFKMDAYCTDRLAADGKLTLPVMSSE